MVKKHLLSYLIVALVMVSETTTKAQTVIGMGTEQPNPNAVLELVPEQGNQGFLAPRLTSAQRQASSFTGRLTSADHGLLVFDINEGKFYYWFDGAWREGTSGETGGPTPGVSGTTWYTGNAAPSGVDASEGDFYINESTGEVFKFSGNAFVAMGSIKGEPAANSPNLSSVLQQGNSAGSQKITDLGAPTEDNDAATKAYVDSHNDADDQSLENVLTEGNTANDNYQIKGLIDPTDLQDAATKAYVDGRDLEDILNAGNDAGNKQIVGLASPTADGHATNRKYVDDQDNAVSVSSKITNFSFDTDNKTLNLTEGSVPYTVNLGTLNNGTPAALPEGNMFVGNSSDAPQAVTITGDISISPTGVVTITNITTAKIVDAAVTKEKINADVAGNGLSKNTTDGSLEINTGNGLNINSGQLRITPFPEGWIGVGQGLSNDMDFKEVQRDATLNKDGELTVTGLQGRPIATTAPSNNEVLQYNGGQWAPAALPPGGGGAQVSTGSGNPNGGTGNKGDVYVKDDGTIFIKTKANSSLDSWSPIPKTLSGNGEPGNGTGNRGDIYTRDNGAIYIKGANGWMRLEEYDD
jgi:hypothetical protein